LYKAHLGKRASKQESTCSVYSQNKGILAEITIKKHVQALSRLPGYNAMPNHREFSEKARFVIICALQKVPDGTIFCTLFHPDGKFGRKDNDTITDV